MQDWDEIEKEVLLAKVELKPLSIEDAKSVVYSAYNAEPRNDINRAAMTLADAVMLNARRDAAVRRVIEAVELYDSAVGHQTYAHDLLKACRELREWKP